VASPAAAPRQCYRGRRCPRPRGGLTGVLTDPEISLGRRSRPATVGRREAGRIRDGGTAACPCRTPSGCRRRATPQGSLATTCKLEPDWALAPSESPKPKHRNTGYSDALASARPTASLAGSPPSVSTWCFAARDATVDDETVVAGCCRLFGRVRRHRTIEVEIADRRGTRPRQRKDPNLPRSPGSVYAVGNAGGRVFSEGPIFSVGLRFSAGSTSGARRHHDCRTTTHHGMVLTLITSNFAGAVV